MSAANRRRGHDAERNVAKWLRGQGFPDARTTRAKLGHDGATAPGDVEFHPLITLEVKDVAASAWPTWCRQAAAEAHPGTVPVVVRRTRGVPNVGLWTCRIRLAESTDLLPRTLLARALDPIDGHYWLVTSMAALVLALHDEAAAPVASLSEKDATSSGPAS